MLTSSCWWKTEQYRAAHAPSFYHNKWKQLECKRWRFDDLQQYQKQEAASNNNKIILKA